MALQSFIRLAEGENPPRAYAILVSVEGDGGYAILPSLVAVGKFMEGALEWKLQCVNSHSVRVAYMQGYGKKKAEKIISVLSSQWKEATGENLKIDAWEERPPVFQAVEDLPPGYACLSDGRAVSVEAETLSLLACEQIPDSRVFLRDGKDFQLSVPDGTDRAQEEILRARLTSLISHVYEGCQVGRLEDGKTPFLQLEDRWECPDGRFPLVFRRAGEEMILAVLPTPWSVGTALRYYDKGLSFNKEGEEWQLLIPPHWEEDRTGWLVDQLESGLARVTGREIKVKVVKKGEKEG